MKILKKAINSQGQGYIFLKPEDEEDLWYIYNLVTIGDCIKATTFRKVQIKSTTGSVQSDKKLIKLTLQVIDIQYNSNGEGLELSIKGKNIEENEYINIGQYHTVKIEINRPFSIIKSHWDKYHFETLKESQQQQTNIEIAAMVMDEGIAHLCNIKNNMTILKHKVDKNIPKKKSGSEFHEKAMEKFYEICFDVLKSLDFEKLKCIIIASPGFVKDQFMEHIKEQSQKTENKILKKNIGKILLVKSSSGYLNSLLEVLADPTVLEQLKDTKAIEEVKILDKFFQVMKENSDKICYGPKFTVEANLNQAIDTLLITNTLFKTKNLKQRKIYHDLVDSVKDLGGNVQIFSSQHHTGEKLNNLSGIAAILRFPLNLDYLDEEEEQSEEQYNDEIDTKESQKLLVQLDIDKEVEEDESEYFKL